MIASRQSVTLLATCAWVGLMALPSFGQQLLTNTNFETVPLPGDDWTLTGASRYKDDAAWFGSASPHSPTHYAAVANNGGTASGTVWQSAGLPFGSATYNLTLTFWGLIFDIGGDPDTITGQIVVDGAVVASVQMTHADGFDTYVQKQVNWVGPANTEIKVNVLLNANGSGGGGNWGVVCVDDVSLTGSGSPTQHVITSIDPDLIADNLSNTTATISGTNLTGASAAKLVKGDTVLTGVINSIAVDGLSMEVEFPTTSAPFGVYNVVVEKTGNTPVTLFSAFRIRDPNGSFLVNGNFETGNLTGWTFWGSDWGGAMSNLFVGSSGWIHTPKDGGVDKPAYGTYSFRVGEYNGNGGEGGVLQHVPVFSGETLALDWKWGGGNTVNNAAVEIGVLKGAYASAFNYNGADILQLVRLDNPVSFGWSDGSLSFTVPAGVEVVTVYTKVWSWTSGAWTYVALWVDNMTLTKPNCPDQHELTSIDPESSDAGSTVNLTVNGSNLDQVTGIRLARGLDQIVGTITGQNYSQLTVQFIPPAGGATPGGYDVVTEQAGCFGRILSQAFDFTCDPITFSAVTPNMLEKPQQVVDLVVSGTSVPSADEVRLVLVPEPRDPPGDRAPYWMDSLVGDGILGTLVDGTDPDAPVYSFDLANAQAGTYKVVGSRSGSCSDPAELPNAFTMTMPDPGDNALANGGFETGEIAPWVLTPKTGLTLKGDPIPGPVLAYTDWVGNGSPDNIGYPVVPGIVPPYSGDEVRFAHGGNYLVGAHSFSFDSNPPGPKNAGLEWNTWLSNNSGWLTQSIGLPSGPGQYSLVLSFWVSFWDQNWPHANLTASIVVDDVPVSSVLVNFPNGYGFATQDGWDSYTQVSLDYIGQAFNDISVSFYFDVQNDEGGTYSAATAAVTIDDVHMTGITPCGTPFADVDGDQDVDQDDFSFFQSCYTGNVQMTLSEGCRCLDRDDDSDVDQADYDDFEACATGPDIGLDPEDSGTWPAGCEQ